MRLLVITGSTVIAHTVVNSVRLVKQWEGHSGVWSRSGLVSSALVCAALGYQLKGCHVQVVNLQ